MRKGMKQVLAALLALTMLFGAVGAFAEEDTEISSDELFNQMDEEADQTEDVSLDEPMDTDTDELTEEEKAALEALDHAEGGVTIDEFSAGNQYEPAHERVQYPAAGHRRTAGRERLGPQRRNDDLLHQYR